MSYGELYRRAARWRPGCGSGRSAGRAGRAGDDQRGPEQIVGILGTVMAGAAYLPIDAALPAERRGYMLRDGRVRCVLTNAGWPGPDTEVSALDARCRRKPSPAGAADYVPPPDATPDDLAYVLYTSGTTGEPKGVMVSQRSVANVVADCNARFGIDAADRFFGISAFNFDLSVYDVFGALSAGAAIVLPDPDDATDPARWLERCAKAGRHRVELGARHRVAAARPGGGRRHRAAGGAAAGDDERRPDPAGRFPRGCGG